MSVRALCAALSSGMLVGLVVPGPAGAAARDDEAVTVLLGGDVLLGRNVVPADGPLAASLLDFVAFLAEQRQNADRVLINLESPFGTCLPGGTVNRPRLCAREGAEQLLVRGRVDLVGLANNHTLDAGSAGLEETVRLLRSAGIESLGTGAALTGKPVAERVAGLVIVSASISPAAHPPAARLGVPTAEQLAAAVRQARLEEPVRPVLVWIHGGRENDPHPGQRDHEYAQAAVEAGAAAVVFHGAHRVRPLVTMSGVPVHFGLGNLLFDQRHPEAARGVLLRLEFRPGQPARVLETVEVSYLVQNRRVDLLRTQPSRTMEAVKR